MESLRTFTGLLFLKQITGRELLFGAHCTTGSNKDINYWIYLTEISYLSTICMRNGCRLRLLLLRISRASTPITSVHTHQKQKIKQIKRQILCKEDHKICQNLGLWFQFSNFWLTPSLFTDDYSRVDGKVQQILLIEVRYPKKNIFSGV